MSSVILRFLKWRVIDIVLFGVVGELGAGKTLSMSYLAWNNWKRKGRKLYSNYNLYGVPFTKVKSIPDLQKMSAGFFAADELWLWVDSWASKSQKSQIISSILLRSRKREITIAYTAQSMQQINNRIRNITDFVAYPSISTDNVYTKMLVFKGGGNISMGSMVPPPIYFYNLPMYAFYNTQEEIAAVEEDTEQQECFFHVRENDAFKKYLRAQGMNENQVLKQCDDMEKILNPEGITTEDEHQKNQDFNPI